MKWKCDNCGDITEAEDSGFTRTEGNEQIPMPWDASWRCWKCGKGAKRPLLENKKKEQQQP